MSIMTDVQNNPLVGMMASYTFTVAASGPVNPSFSMVSSQNPSTVGQSVTFTASVTGSAGAGTGTVSFRNGGIDIGGCAGVALSGGTGACTVSNFTVATHSITAQYSGNASYNPATTAPIQQVVKANPAVGLTSSVNPSTTGQ